MELFANITVLSLEQATVLPYLTYRLAAEGMNVIRVEHPERPDPNRFVGRDVLGEKGMNTYYFPNNVSKKAITLNLGGEEGQALLRELILKLDPKPGWRYSNVASGYVSPDFVIRWRDNRLVAHLNEDTMPRVRLRRQYVEILKNPKGVPREQLDFIRQRARAAQHVIIAIEQRRRTMLRILDSLLEYQREFFENGYNYLKPITMTEFARQLSVNPSTISRALANKYIESPQGIHKLKFFFNAPIGDTDKRIVFQKIQEMVDNEDKSSPLSDTQISQKLGRQGIVISRRTISKYRDLMGIPAQQYRGT